MPLLRVNAGVIRLVAEVALFVVIAATAVCLIVAGAMRGPLAGLAGSFATMAALLGLSLLFQAGRWLYRRFIR